MKIWGYTRVSTGRQSIERQIRNISAAYPDAVIIKEVYTGTTDNRPEWRKLMSKVRPGDTIIFDSVSRMSRNADEGYRTYQDLYAQGVNLAFLKEPHINTSVYRDAQQTAISTTGDEIADCFINATNQVIMILAERQIKTAFDQAEKEVMDLRKRTAEGIETARRNGKQIGQRTGAHLTTKKSIKAKEIILKHSKDFNGTLSDPDCIKLAGVSRNSFYAYKKQLRAER